jgi:mannose-1-phosphate guanylyltransferase
MSLGMALHYATEEQPLGTAGAVKNVEHLLDGTFVVCNGDIFTDLDLTAVLAFHRSSGASVTIVVTPVEDPSPYGMVEMEPDGRIRTFVEKPKPAEVTTVWANAGTYVVEPQVLRHVPAGQPFMFERGLFPRLLELGAPLFAYRSRAYWRDIGTVASYLKLHHELLLGSAQVPLGWPQTGPGLWVGEGCSIDPTAQMRGPLMLGRRCRIGAGARLLGPAVLGHGCVIEGHAEVSGAVLWEEVGVGAQAVLGGCVVGSGARVEPGCYVGPGCVLGDGSVVGQGNRLDGGVALWPGKRLEAGAITFLNPR